MGSLAAWLASIAWPIVGRVLLSLGVGTISYAALSVALNSALSAAKSSFSGLTPVVLQLLTLSGFFDALSIIAGAMIASLALVTLKRFALTTGSGS